MDTLKQRAGTAGGWVAFATLLILALPTAATAQESADGVPQDPAIERESQSAMGRFTSTLGQRLRKGLLIGRSSPEASEPFRPTSTPSRRTSLFDPVKVRTPTDSGYMRTLTAQPSIASEPPPPTRSIGDTLKQTFQGISPSSLRSKMAGMSSKLRNRLAPAEDDLVIDATPAMDITLPTEPRDASSVVAAPPFETEKEQSKSNLQAFEAKQAAKVSRRTTSPVKEMSELSPPEDKQTLASYVKLPSDLKPIRPPLADVERAALAEKPAVDDATPHEVTLDSAVRPASVTTPARDTDIPAESKLEPVTQDPVLKSVTAASTPMTHEPTSDASAASPPMTPESTSDATAISSRRFARGEGNRLQRTPTLPTPVSGAHQLQAKPMRDLLEHLSGNSQPEREDGPIAVRIVHSTNTQEVSVTRRVLNVQADQQGSDGSTTDDGLKPMDGIMTEINPDGKLPPNAADKKFSQQEPVQHVPGTSRDWTLYQYWWAAPALRHSPLYYEEVNLERYGYSHGKLQPAFSAAHFFGSTAALPYLMAANPPCEDTYTLGHYRPGSYAPYQLHRPPFSVKGGLSQAAVMTGLFLVIP